MIPECIKKQRLYLNERNDCSVIAVSLVCNVEYNEAHRIMRDLGRKHRKVTKRIITYEAIKKLGCWLGPKQDCSAKTVRYLPMTLPNGRWLVFTAGHVLAVIDGEVLDWTEGRRHRPKTMREVSL